MTLRGPLANIQPMPELLQPDTPDFPRVSKQARAIYRLLYEHQNQPLTMLEIREMTEAELGPQEQLDRRRRELNRYFKIVKVAGSSHQKRRSRVAMPPGSHRLTSPHAMAGRGRCRWAGCPADGPFQSSARERGRRSSTCAQENHGSVP